MGNHFEISGYCYYSRLNQLDRLMEEQMTSNDEPSGSGRQATPGVADSTENEFTGDSGTTKRQPVKTLLLIKMPQTGLKKNLQPLKTLKLNKPARKHPTPGSTMRSIRL